MTHWGKREGGMAQFSLRRLWVRLYHAVTDLRWWVLFAFLFAHMIATWLLMHFVGEEPEFERLPTFIYWYATTASTIGYGDLTPKTDAGRLINAFFVYPGAIAVFTSIVTKAIAEAAERVRRGRAGLGDYRAVKHAIVLVGYNPDRTPRMIEELCADAAADQELILLTSKEVNHHDARYRYVRAQSYIGVADLQRAGVADAHRIIVFRDTDAETLAAGLAIGDLNKTAHIVCYFQHEELARLLVAHCRNVEVVLAPAIELVVKAVKDPGASLLLADLVSATDSGVTLFSMRWQGEERASFRDMATRFMDHGAVLVSARRDGGVGGFRYAGGEVGTGDRLFYIAEGRLDPARVGAAA
jgi:voltage-gated potassium channel